MEQAVLAGRKVQNERFSRLGESKKKRREIDGKVPPLSNINPIHFSLVSVAH